MNSPTIETGDVSWMLIATVLVMLMTPALALFYSGLVKQRNVLNTLMMSMVSLGVVSLLWALIGYSLAFAPGNSFIGGLDYLALKGVGQSPLSDSVIPHQLFMLFQMMFAVITPALISGAVVGRIKFSTYTLFIGLWSVLVYSPLCYWVWGGGWLSQHGALDFAGGTVVHISAGVAALVAAIILGPRAEHEQKIGRAHNVPMTVIGASLLWIGWFGFNAGSALGANEIATHAMVTTHLAATAAMGTWILLDIIVKKRPSVTGICMGLVVGLVSITPAAGYVLSQDAILIGSLGALCSYGALLFLENRKLDDTLDVFACHGVAGIAGSILTGVFANVAVNPAGANGLWYGDTNLLEPQIEATLVAIVFSGAMTAVILKLLEKTIGLRVHGDQELDIDQNLHNETAYAGYQHVPLGELLIHAGLVNEAQVIQCLAIQKENPIHQPLGEILISRKLIQPKQLWRVLVKQKLAA